jgi:hypothetical protein
MPIGVCVLTLVLLNSFQDSQGLRRMLLEPYRAKKDRVTPQRRHRLRLRAVRTLLKL